MQHLSSDTAVMVFRAASVREGCVLFGSNLRLAPVSAQDIIIVE